MADMAADQPATFGAGAMRKGIDDDRAASAGPVERDLSKTVGASTMLGVPWRSYVAEEVDEICLLRSDRNAVGTGRSAEADRAEVTDFENNQWVQVQCREDLLSG